MAKCSNCKKEVGCGCNLKNGLCGSCNPSVSVKPQIPVIHPQQIVRGNRIHPKPQYNPPKVNSAYWTK